MIPILPSENHLNSSGSALMGALFEMAHALNRRQVDSPEEFVRGARALAAMLGTLGLTEPRPAGADVPRELGDQIVSLVRARADARTRRDWKRADELRAELTGLGVTVKDTAQGTDWEWKGVRGTERA